MKTVRVVTTSSGSFEAETNATTLSEMLNEDAFARHINSSNMRFKIRGEKDDLSLSSNLPNEDFILFASPQKTKSGN